MYSARAAFASLPPLSLPPPPIPHPPHPSPHLSLPSPPSPSPSRPIPRSPLRSPPPREPDSPIQTLQDVLNVADHVGPGLLLHGQPLRQVQSSPPPDHVFEVVRKLGSGSYAVVYLVREILHLPRSKSSLPDNHQLAFGDDDELDVPQDPPTEYGREFAIKCLSKANLDKEALDAQLFEVTVHQSIPAHPNIVTLHSALESDAYLLLVLECVPGEDLFYFLEQSRDHHPHRYPHYEPAPSVTPPTPSLLSSLHPAQLLSPARLRLIASMFAQMCDAVAHCHSAGVFHRDIKPENFIVTDAWLNGDRRVVVKLTDFGLATRDEESTDMDCGSAPYMSYECRNNCAPTYSTRAADVWSLGIVLINMLYHHNPWSDTTAGACPAFEAFRVQPVAFFLQRFPGMTRPVADFFANRVFRILDHSDVKRVCAAEFGRWVRALPTLLAPSTSPTADPTALSRLPPVLPSPRSRRPSSRPPSRSSSRTPSQQRTSPDFELVQTSLPEGNEGEHESSSRATSTTRRRKRGARKGRGAANAPPDPLTDLAAASQILAREASKKKQSKWKGVFRMAPPDPDHPSVVNVLPPASFLPPRPPSPKNGPSATAANVSTLIMALSPDPVPPPHYVRGRRTDASWRSTATTMGSISDASWRATPSPADTSWRAPMSTTPTQSSSDSPNWRTSSSASSMMSGGSAFTRFSNSSMRSVSTVATSVSAASTTVSGLSPPANIKLMSGVPWEIDELPRLCHPRPQDHVFAPPPTQRRAAKRLQLDTISEPAGVSGSEESDETGAGGGGGSGSGAAAGGEEAPKKVQKGQINALAKMLSALKANRGAH